ncbi:hypothetical protein F5148DRAFT_981107, partial [Russula earlei]
QFSAEFALGDDIANASGAQRHCVWMPTTNDHNEGALRTMCVAKCKAPNITLKTFNTHKMFKYNNTHQFMNAITHCDKLHIKSNGRGGGNSDRRNRHRQIVHWLQQISKQTLPRQEKKPMQAAKLDSLDCVFDINALERLNIEQMTLQLAWHQRLDNKVPMCKELPWRLEILRALTEAVARDNIGADLVDRTTGMVTQFC